MDYKQFIIQAFEREPNKWRAKIFRYTGKPLITGRKRIMQFVTGVDATTASAALLRAVEAIDAGAFSRPAPHPKNSGVVRAGAQMRGQSMTVQRSAR
jgi:hypothetical protein